MENVPRAIGRLDREFNWTKTWRRCKVFFFSSKVVDCKTDMICGQCLWYCWGVYYIYIYIFICVFKTCFWNHGCVTPKDSSFWHFRQAFSCFGRECLCSMGAFGSKHNAATTCKNIFISASTFVRARHFRPQRYAPTAGDCDALVAQRPSAKDLTDVSRGVTFRLGPLPMSHPRVGLANGEKLNSHASTLRGSTKKMGMCFFLKGAQQKHGRFFVVVPMRTIAMRFLWHLWMLGALDIRVMIKQPVFCSLNGSYIP